MLLWRSKVMISNSEHDDHKRIGRVNGMQVVAKRYRQKKSEKDATNISFPPSKKNHPGYRKET